MAMNPPVISIDGDVEIPMSELQFATSRSSGPGGQNVNKVETRVTLSFDLAASPSLSPEQKARIAERLATRVTKAGILRVTAQRHRSQGANRKLVLERFVELLRDALAEEAPRRPTRVPRLTKRKRLDEKRRRGELKRQRSGDLDGEI
ncbi:MAG TPA: alternative ribosome rescue aminoacyl-tRNA hydrolase ArfB [Thermoanaerobaculia bacterium]|nr:alternative ribosome rescue aminoacyl-tRNA hydrolase ArfB [Thermoanaerobaculia bacterium]